MRLGLILGYDFHMTQSDQAISVSPEQWVDRHGDVMLRYAVARVRSIHVAEDLVQETLLSAMKNAGTFRGEAAERTWLIGILRHKILDHIRTSKREQTETELAPDDRTESLFDKTGHWTKSAGPSGSFWAIPDAGQENAEFWAAVEGCLEQLPLKVGQAFALRTLDDIPAEEVCKVLGVTSTNFWVLLHRARTRMRNCLEQKWSGSRR